MALVHNQPGHLNTFRVLSVCHSPLSGPQSRVGSGLSEDKAGGRVWNQPALTFVLLTALNLSLLICEAEGSSDGAHPTGTQGSNVTAALRGKGFCFFFDKPCKMALAHQLFLSPEGPEVVLCV